jgi:hypothetical protein
LEPRLEVGDSVLQLGDPSLERLHDRQDGGLGFEGPVFQRDSGIGGCRPREGWTILLYRKFGL